MTRMNADKEECRVPLRGDYYAGFEEMMMAIKRIAGVVDREV